MKGKKKEDNFILSMGLLMSLAIGTIIAVSVISAFQDKEATIVQQCGYAIFGVLSVTVLLMFIRWIIGEMRSW